MNVSWYAFFGSSLVLHLLLSVIQWTGKVVMDFGRNCVNIEAKYQCPKFLSVKELSMKSLTLEYLH